MFRCHRQLVADALTARGIPTYHIVSHKSARVHELNPRAVIENGCVTYPGVVAETANNFPKNNV
jgi:hypothetical protein